MITWLNELWASFLTGFCKVDLVCYNWEPNWLGSALIGIVGLSVLYYAMYIFDSYLYFRVHKHLKD